jgi:DNA replicative helicase MCM subunit Mcm2 (Cdc46/Mcm family)
MSILKDYIGYARACVLPKLSEEASQALIQVYVGECLFYTSQYDVTQKF